MKKRIPLILYIVILILLAVVLNTSRGVLSFTLFITVLLYFPISFIYMLYERSVLRIYQELNGRKLYKNKAEQYTLMIRNEGPLAIGGIHFLIREGITAFTNDIINDSIELLPRESKELHSEICLKYAGSYEAGITDILMQDVFGIIRLKYHIPAPMRVQVMPAVTNMADRVLDQMIASMSNGRKIMADTHNEEIMGADLRAYEPGDPIRQIHWKNYARSGELYVRLPDTPDTRLQSVLLIPEPMDYSLSSIERRDHFIEYAVSIANYYAKRKKPVSFILGEDGKRRILVEDYEGFDRFYQEITKEMKIGSGNKATENEANMILREKDNSLCLNVNR